MPKKPDEAELVAPTVPQNPIAFALLRAQDACKAGVQMDRKHPHGYSYASAEAVLHVARQALADAGLVLVPQQHSVVEIGSTDPQIAPRRYLKRDFLLLHQDGGCLALSVDGWPVISHKGREPDKALAAALTLSLRYLLRDLLLLPQAAEEEIDLETGEIKPARPAPSAEDVALQHAQREHARAVSAATQANGSAAALASLQPLLDRLAKAHADGSPLSKEEANALYYSAAEALAPLGSVAKTLAKGLWAQTGLEPDALPLMAHARNYVERVKDALTVKGA